MQPLNQLLIASNANVGGPATTTAMVSSKRWPSLVRPALLVGALRYTVGDNDWGAERIAEALKRNKSISTINLGGNNIYAEGTSHIANALKDNTTITTLEFSYNPIGMNGAKVLAAILKFHGKIETLRLGWCQIGIKGAEAIADCLQYNATISSLDLRANSLGDDEQVALTALH